MRPVSRSGGAFSLRAAGWPSADHEWQSLYVPTCFTKTRMSESEAAIPATIREPRSEALLLR